MADSVTPLGQWLVQRCLERQESRADLAQSLGISAAFLSALIHGRKQWPARVLQQLLQQEDPLSVRRFIQCAGLVSGPELRIPLVEFSLAEREAILRWLVSDAPDRVLPDAGAPHE